MVGKTRGGTSGIRAKGPKKVPILEPVKEETPIIESMLTPTIAGQLDIEFQTNPFKTQK
jgi:hypothetical protein